MTASPEFYEQVKIKKNITLNAFQLEYILRIVGAENLFLLPVQAADEICSALDLIKNKLKEEGIEI